MVPAHRYNYTEEALNVKKIYFSMLKQGLQDLDLMLEKEEYVEGLIEIASCEKDKWLRITAIRALGLIGYSTRNVSTTEKILSNLSKLLEKEKKHEIRMPLFRAIFYLFGRYLDDKKIDESKKFNLQMVYHQALSETKTDYEKEQLLNSVLSYNTKKFLDAFNLPIPSDFIIVEEKDSDYERYRIVKKENLGGL